MTRINHTASLINTPNNHNFSYAATLCINLPPVLINSVDTEKLHPAGDQLCANAGDLGVSHGEKFAYIDQVLPRTYLLH